MTLELKKIKGYDFYTAKIAEILNVFPGATKSVTDSRTSKNTTANSPTTGSSKGSCGSGPNDASEW